MHSNVDVMLSKNMSKGLFNSLVVKKKMLSSWMVFAFLGRPFFFSTNFSEALMDASN